VAGKKRVLLQQVAPTVDLGIAGWRVPIRSHLAYPWQTEDDFARAVGFLEAGLRGSDHCMVRPLRLSSWLASRIPEWFFELVARDRFAGVLLSLKLLTRVETALLRFRNIMRRGASIISAGLLVGIAALVVLRCGQLLFQGNILTARNERRFFDWAYGAAGFMMKRQLPKVAPALAEGEVVCFSGELVDSAGQPPKDPSWRLVMTNYFLSRQIVVVPTETSSPRGPACRRTLLLARPNSPLLLIRQPNAVARR
jgi:hypothetical protein